MFEVYEKVITVEALQNTGDNLKEFRKLESRKQHVTISDKVVTIDIYGPYSPQLRILVGDWLITSTDGDLQDVMPDKEFKKVYEKKTS